jgi:hypothetical protein
MHPGGTLWRVPSQPGADRMNESIIYGLKDLLRRGVEPFVSAPDRTDFKVI